MSAAPLLLDTHVLLWWLATDSRLTREARAAIEDPSRLVQVSAATVWEVGIKRASGKLDAPDDLLAQIDENFHPLMITLEHAEVAGGLPPIHADPFDRMLVAQAIVDDLVLCTADSQLADYDVTILSAR